MCNLGLLCNEMCHNETHFVCGGTHNWEQLWMGRSCSFVRKPQDLEKLLTRGATVGIQQEEKGIKITALGLPQSQVLPNVRPEVCVLPSAERAWPNKGLGWCHWRLSWSPQAGFWCRFLGSPSVAGWIGETGWLRRLQTCLIFFVPGTDCCTELWRTRCFKLNP